MPHAEQLTVQCAASLPDQHWSGHWQQQVHEHHSARAVQMDLQAQTLAETGAAEPAVPAAPAEPTQGKETIFF